MQNTNMETGLKEIFENNNNYLQTRLLNKRSQYYQLKKLVGMGEVTQIKRGLYRLNSGNSGSELAEVCRIFAPGVICLFSAWQFYNLSTFVPSVHHLTIPGKAKLVLPAYPPIKLYYWYGVSYDLGKTEIKFRGQTICIYDLEKSVCDAIKFRNKVGSDVASEVLKNYLKRNDRNIDLLMRYARLLRVEHILQQNLKVLL